MDTPIVACIQHHLIVPKTADEYPAYLSRFLRMAKAKGAVLALFPELSGIAAAIPTLSGWRNELLRAAGPGLNARPGLWDRAKAAMASGAASVVQAGLHKSLASALQSMPESLYDAYTAMFASLARQYEMTLVAGSLLEVQPETQDILNVCIVFGPDGSILGRQAKVSVAGRLSGMATAGAGWSVIETPAGRVGVLLGEDALFPESARILAYQGADMLLTMAAVNRPATYQKIRQAALARCQENQLYGMVAFLTGPDPFAGSEAPPFVGASSIFAPSDFTPRFSGVMVEIGSPLAEGVITAEWDYPALVELWDESDTPLRRQLPLVQAGPTLSSLYALGLPLPEAGALAPTQYAAPSLPYAAPLYATPPAPQLSPPEAPAMAPSLAPQAAEARQTDAALVVEAGSAETDGDVRAMSPLPITADPDTASPRPVAPAESATAAETSAPSVPESEATPAPFRFPWQRNR